MVNKKKKKPAANPARGFATTSTVSKSQLEEANDAKADAATAAEEAQPTGTVNTDGAGQDPEATTSADKEKDIHELTPDQLEAHLNHQDLLRFVNDHAARIGKESSRVSTKLQTEKRVLRPQADFLSIKDWLPHDIVKQIVELHAQDKPRNRGHLKSDDELVANLWLLQSCLSKLNFPETLIAKIVASVCEDGETADKTQTWGLTNAFDWLGQHRELVDLHDYDSVWPGITKEDGLVVTEPIAEQSATVEEHKSAEDAATEKPSQSSPATERGETAVQLSDSESDLDEEQLTKSWLRAHEQLFELDPSGNAMSTTRKNVAPQNSKSSVTERKLRTRISRYESDILFDKKHAERLWTERRVSLFKAQALRKKLHLNDEQPRSPPENDDGGVQTNGHNEVNDEAERIGQELLAEAQDDSMLAGIFDSEPGMTAPEPQDSSTNSTRVTIHDFGKMTGVSPKRVLEEVCKAQDAKCTVSYKMISPTTYSCRHAVTVTWSQQRDVSGFRDFNNLTVASKARSVTLSMTSIAATDTSQSEAFVATAALFFLTAHSPTESKAYMRLPSAFREVWDGFAQELQEKVEKENCETVKELRDLVEQHRPSQEDEGTTTRHAESRRNRTASSSSTESRVISSTTKSPPEDLKQMWDRKTSSPAYRHMLKQRTNLPMYSFRTRALETIDQNQITILCGETGCGKSTQLPAFILEHQLEQGQDCKVYVTETRRIATISLAARVSEEMGEPKGHVGTNGSLVGYAIRLDSHISPSNKLIYATVGIVLRMLENAEGLDAVTHLVLDEVHERTIETDFLLIVLKDLLVKRPDLKVILMSATVDAQKFSAYFSGAPIINVPGRTFPVEVVYLPQIQRVTGHTALGNDGERSDDDELDMLQSTEHLKAQQIKNKYRSPDQYRTDYELIVKLLDHIASDHDDAPFSKAVLVFLSGIEQIRRLHSMLAGHNTFVRGWNLYTLHSSLSSEDQQAAFNIPPPGIRKIILSTNIAETGITIPDATCVIDTGKHKQMRFDERRQLSRLGETWISCASAEQRRGRAGRVQAGKCYRLYELEVFENLMADHQTPEMLRLSLQDLAMRVKICKLGAIDQTLAKAMDPPSSKNIARAVDALIEVGALTSGEELTTLGQQLAELPLDARLGKLVLFGGIYSCLDFALTAAAALSSKSPFRSSVNAREQAKTARLGFKRGDSDLLTTYNAYIAWRKICQRSGSSEQHFCNKNLLSSQNLAAIEDLKGQLLRSLVDAGFVRLDSEEKSALSRSRYSQRGQQFVALPSKYCSADENDELINSVIAWSFYPKLLRRQGNGWRSIANNQALAISSASLNKHQLPANVQNLSFYSVMQTSSRGSDAQETSPVSDFSVVLLAGEAVFNMWAGVVIIDGNRLRFRVQDWETMFVLKVLRMKMKECQARLLRYPSQELSASCSQWVQVFDAIFEHKRAAVLDTKTSGGVNPVLRSKS